MAMPVAISRRPPNAAKCSRQLLRFVVTGGFVTALGVGVYALVALVLRWHPQLGNFLAYRRRDGDRLCAAQPVELSRPWRRSGPISTKLRFVTVSMISYALNSFWVWLLFTHLDLGPRRADPADAVRHPGRDLRPQPAVGFPLMERVVYDQMAELDQRHWWYRARREVLAALIRRPARPPRDAAILEVGCGTGHNLAMLGRVRRVDALELDRRGARASPRSGSAGRSTQLAAARARRRARAALRPDRRVRRDRAYRRRPSGARVDRAAAQARRQAGRSTVPAHQWMWSAHDVVNHHQRRYSKRGAAAPHRRLAAAARSDRLFQQPAVPARGRRANGVEASRQGRQAT